VERQSITGGHLLGQPDDFHYRDFAVTGFYEWRTLAMVRAFAPRGGTVVEVGANVGTETVGLADLVGPSGCVHAFEPLSRNAQLLSLNSERFHWTNVEIHRLALSDKAGTLQFTIPAETSSGTGHLLRDASRHPASELPHDDMPTYEAVDVATLDDVAERFERLDFLACDTEGEEVRVLGGARRTLERWAPPMVLEASPKLLVRAGSSLQELLSTLESMEYKAYAVARFGLTPVTTTTVAQATHATNWLCLPSSHASKGRLRALRSIVHCGWAPRVWRMNPLDSARTRAT